MAAKQSSEGHVSVTDGSNGMHGLISMYLLVHEGGHVKTTTCNPYKTISDGKRKSQCSGLNFTWVMLDDEVGVRRLNPDASSG
jgi:hypothetical protein